MRQRPTARQLAVEILENVDKDGAYANLELDKRLRGSYLSTKDKAFVTELVYGTLRWRSVLDATIAKASSRPLVQLTPALLAILRITAYQLFYLDRVPAHAAVHESVETAKLLMHEGAGRFVNAVARHMQRNGKVAPADGVGFSPAQLAQEWSHPVWLVERWLATYGHMSTVRMLAANQEPAPTSLRVNTLRSTPADCLEQLQQVGIAAQPGATPDAIRLQGSAAVADLPGYGAGFFVVQDESSQLASIALQPLPGQCVLDLCSAPGGKTTHIAQLMHDEGTVVAMELHPHRAALVERAADRLGLRSVRVLNQDSRQIPPELAHKVDGVLLDAPCSGTGVLRRRVDLRWRLVPGDLPVLCTLQRQLLAAAAAAVRPGGRLIYSTCSVEREENSDQVMAFLTEHPDFSRGSLSSLSAAAPLLANPDEHPELADGELQLLPGSHVSDGFFLACLERKL